MTEAGTLIPPAELRQPLGGSDTPTVIGVRDTGEYAAGHVSGELHIPVDQLRARPAGVPRGRPVVTRWNTRHRGDSRRERAAALVRASGHDARARR